MALRETVKTIKQHGLAARASSGSSEFTLLSSPIDAAIFPACDHHRHCCCFVVVVVTDIYCARSETVVNNLDERVSPYWIKEV